MFISVTQLTQLLGCPRQWRYQRQDKKVPKKYNLIFATGECVHKAMEVAVQHQIDNPDAGQMPLADILDVASDTWKLRLEDSAKAEEALATCLREAADDQAAEKARDIYFKRIIDPFDSITGRSVTPDEAQAEIRSLTRQMARHLPMVENPLRAEWGFKVELPGSPGDFVVGKVDLIDRPAQPDGSFAIRVSDFKTSLFPFKRGKEDTELQPAVYLWAVQQATPGKVRPKGGFRYLGATKTTFKPATVWTRETNRPAELKHDPDALDAAWPSYAAWLEEEMREVVKMVKANAFPAQPKWEACGYCDFRQKCLPWLPVPVAVDKEVAASVTGANLIED